MIFVEVKFDDGLVSILNDDEATTTKTCRLQQVAICEQIVKTINVVSFDESLAEVPTAWTVHRFPSRRVLSRHDVSVPSVHSRSLYGFPSRRVRSVCSLRKNVGFHRVISSLASRPLHD